MTGQQISIFFCKMLVLDSPDVNVKTEFENLNHKPHNLLSKSPTIHPLLALLCYCQACLVTKILTFYVTIYVKHRGQH